MIFLLTGIHVIVCLFLIFVVLLQSAQAADLAGAFGGGGSQTALGMRGATTLLHKATTGAAVMFMVTSLALGMMDGGSSSLLEGLDEPAATTPAGETTPAPETPAAAEPLPDAEGAEEGADGDATDTDPEGGEGESGDESGTEPDGAQQ
ncbi:MAG: preprotein translocase subunit SecG [Acidobacteria bacterium]|nr:preprotein translocase subunit SecG [Acidobacteriota bacterium]